MAPDPATPLTKENVQEAFQNALTEHSKAMGSQRFNNVSGTPNMFDRGYDDIASGRTRQQNIANFSKFIIKQGETTQKAFDNYLEGANDLMMGFAENYEKINRAIGGYLDHSQLAESGQETMKQAVGRFDDLVDMYGETSDSFIEMQRQKGKELSVEEEARLQTVGVDFVTKFFESGEEAAKIQSQVLNKLITQNSKAINEMDRVSRAQVALIQKNTGISAGRIAEIMENELVRTGKATNDTMFKIAGYSEKLAEETGLSLKLIQDSTSKVIANMQQFGHVTVEEAQRISVQIQQLGMKYETFESLTQKFQDFSTSVSASGDISQLTGGAVQLDAQELAYLASEDQDEFLRELRRSFVDQGFDKDQFLAMTNAEQRAIAQSIGMSRNEFAMLIDREREVSSREQLDIMMKEAEDMGATTEAGGMAAIERQRKELNNAVKSSDDIAEKARRRAMKHYKEYSSQTINNIIDLQTNAVQVLESPEFVQKFNAGVGGMFVNFSDMLATKTKEIKDAGGVVESLSALSSEFTKAGKYNAKAYKEGLSQGGLTNPEVVMQQIEGITSKSTNMEKLETNITRISTILKDVKEQDIDKYKELTRQIKDNIEALNKSSATLSSNQEKLIKALLKGTPIKITVDGKTLTETVIRHAPTTETSDGARLNVETP